METSGRDFALQFHGLSKQDPEVRERFRDICLAHLEISDQQALDLLTDRATRLLCTDISPETIQRVTKHLSEIGIKVDVRDATEAEEFYIPFGSFSADDTQFFEESQLFERPVGTFRTPNVPYSGPSGGYGDDTSLQDYHFSVYPYPEHDFAQAELGIQRHAKLVKRRQNLSTAERAGLAFVGCALLALLAFFVSR